MVTEPSGRETPRAGTPPALVTTDAWALVQDPVVLLIKGLWMS